MILFGLIKTSINLLYPEDKKNCMQTINFTILIKFIELLCPIENVQQFFKLINLDEF